MAQTERSEKTVKYSKDDALRAVRAAYKAIDDKFGVDIVALDISGLTVLADYFIIATANNPILLKTIADNVADKLEAEGIPLRHSEGYPASKWMLLDFGCVVAHIFLREEREFYNLERIWGDAPTVSAESLK
jgi:ribosome-associated protein